MPLYFAYGANMDVAAMTRRTPGGKPLGLARLVRHRFVITEHGYASVVRDPRQMVHGLLWDMLLADIRALDRFEEVDRGLYVKMDQPVITTSGPRRALVYVGTGKPGGKPRAGYLEDLLRAGAEIGLPKAYLAGMAALGQGAFAAPGKKSVSGPRASETWQWGD
ncbi:MAG: gamma-glutamylcyclotransferase [Beijerinckiaceae bacterium]|jgi:gamma-glutamylcyclotransferase (GGCT)/AIG2-like uncharacterized protein YtfP|nr:gamma-glutamylcyclotransferase [Beijerinckiaceae bacterium]